MATSSLELRAAAWDQAKEMAIEIARKINLLGEEAYKQGKYLAVGPLDPQHEERPTQFGHFYKVKFNYCFLDTIPDKLNIGWVVYDTLSTNPLSYPS